MKIEEIKQEYEQEIENVNYESDSIIDNLKNKYLSKKGKIQEALSKIKEIPNEEKPAFGKKINDLREYIENSISKLQEKIENAKYEKELKNTERIDLSEIELKNTGSLHPRTIIQKEIEDIFTSMGFTIVEASREVVSEFENFDAVNVPHDHPARDMQDTFWLENGQVLKTQTSAFQNYTLRNFKPPFKAIFPGRVFRNEDLDACHENTFFQIEGMVVDKDVSVANLKYYMETLLSSILGKKINCRLRPGYFPFVEPGFELDINCLVCGGKGCPVCKNSGWSELLPCGMIHPKVLELGGVNPDEYKGFAFGLGFDRLILMKYGISDIRELNSGNLKFLKQFSK